MMERTPESPSKEINGHLRKVLSLLDDLDDFDSGEAPKLRLLRSAIADLVSYLDPDVLPAETSEAEYAPAVADMRGAVIGYIYRIIATAQVNGDTNALAAVPVEDDASDLHALASVFGDMRAGNPIPTHHGLE